MNNIRKIQHNRQITIPSEIFDKLDLEKGDYIQIEEQNGEIKLKPKQLIDKDQAWFWSNEWQKKEKKAQEDLESGNVSDSFEDIEEMKQAFEERKNE
ncbi:MAG: AbrB/MazE/SpoVT family DNA-binding domain-containing protein [Candidatus Magasanikbacteria bacterium]